MASLTVFLLMYTLFSTVESQFDPKLIIRIDPSHSYLRSAHGYNTVTLNCIVQVYFVSGIQNLTVDWKKNSEVISDNGDVAISDSIIYCHEHKEVCESHLKLICREPGIFTYTCSIVWGYGTVTEDAIVNVGGPVPPIKPYLLSATSSRDFCREATIEWTMDSISYTPETYYVKYGTSRELNNQSVIVYGSEDIHTVDKRYTVQIDGLSRNTQYFYQVIANNSAEKSSSDTECFIECSTEICTVEDPDGVHTDMTKYLIIIVVPSLIVLVLICIIIVLALIAACFVTHHRRPRPGGNFGVERINFADEVPPVYN